MRTDAGRELTRSENRCEMETGAGQRQTGRKDREMKELYIERIYAGWLAKIIGIRYGAPIEGWTYEKIRDLFGERMPDYPADYRLFAADDDSNGPWFFLRALEDGGVCAPDGQKRELEPEDVARALLNYAPFEHGFFWWGGYGVSTEHTAYLNLRNGIPAPESGSIRQNGSTMAEQIGGQIFSDTWGLVNPGKPERAARMARAAASVTHDVDGLNGAAFVASCISAAFCERDIRRVMETGLSFVEAGSTYEQAVRAVMDYYDSHEKDGEAWRDGVDFIKEHYGYDRYPGVCHIIPNAAVMALAMLYGAGDFDRTLEICNLCGWDTDCNVGNVACILGTALGLSAIGEKWRRPVNDLLISSGVLGCYNIQDVPSSAAYIARLAYWLDGEEIPESWREILNGKRRYHFEFPGSTHAMRLRVESAEGEVLDGRMPRMENTAEDSFAGQRSLKVSAAGLEAGDRLYLYQTTYYRPEEFTDSRYDPAFSPILYPGQTLRGAVCLPAYSRPAQVSLYVKDLHTGAILEGERMRLETGEWRELSFTLPGGSQVLAGEAGFCFRMEGRALERFSFAALADEFGWDGPADYCLDMGGEQEEVWPGGGHREIRPFTRLKGNAWLEGGQLHLACSDFGEMYTGDCGWTDYRAEFSLIPVKGSFLGALIRVQGAVRSCGAALLPGKLAILKSRPDGDGYEILGETAFDWKPGERILLELTAEGNRLRAEARSGEDACQESEARSGEDARRAAVQAEDRAGSFRSGCAGILVRDGSHVILERMRIRPASCR